MSESSRNMLTKVAISRISEVLMSSPEHRAEFVSDMDSYFTKYYGDVVPPSERAVFDRLKDLVADGFCCKGCGCSELPERGGLVFQPIGRLRG